MSHCDYEALDEAIDLATEALKAMALGVSAEVPLFPDDDDDGAPRLCFGKAGREWKLSIVWERDGVDEYEPLKNCSREYRVQASRRLDALVIAMNEEYDVQLVEMNMAIDNFRAFASKMGET